MNNPLDQTHLVPGTAHDVAVWLWANRPEIVCHTTETDEGITISDGRTALLRTVTTVTGGTVVSIVPMLGDAHEMASLLDDEKGAEDLVAYETLAGAVLDAVEAVGGIEALRIKGKWRPADPALRPSWSLHAANCNNQAMRLRKAA